MGLYTHIHTHPQTHSVYIYIHIRMHTCPRFLNPVAVSRSHRASSRYFAASGLPSTCACARTCTRMRTPACTRAHSQSLFAAVQRKQSTANHTACACTQPNAEPSSTWVHFCVPRIICARLPRGFFWTTNQNISENYCRP